MAKWSRGMIPALGAGGPGFKSRFGPVSFGVSCAELNENDRGHSELNQGPAGLQPDALPLSYIPGHEVSRQASSYCYLGPEIKGRRGVAVQKSFCQEWDLNPCPLSRTRILMLTPYQGAKFEP